MKALTVLAVTLLFAVNASAAWTPNKSASFKPAVVKAASASPSGVSSYAKGKTSLNGKSGKSTGYNSGGFKAGRR